MVEKRLNELADDGCEEGRLLDTYSKPVVSQGLQDMAYSVEYKVDVDLPIASSTEYQD